METDRTTQKIRIGVIGAGSMGANHIRALSEMNGLFELVGIYDPIVEKARIAERYDTRAFLSVDDLLSEATAVVISCPTSIHKEIALKTAHKGVHALIEKPISESIKDTEEIYRAFNEKGLAVAVGHIERFNPVITALADIIKGREIVGVEVHRCGPFDSRIYDVDVVSDLMIHDIDITANAIFGCKPEKILAVGKKVYGGKFVDYAQSTMVFPGGVIASITASRSTEDKVRTICVHTKGAYIEGDLLHKTLTIKQGTSYEKSEKTDQDVYYQSNLTEHIVLQNVEPLKEEHKDFRKAILYGNDPLVCEEQVIRSMNLLESVKEEIYKRN